jgi:integrase
MSKRSHSSVPSYRLHKQSGQAVTTLTDGLGTRRDVLLGRHRSKESRLEYARVISEWEANGRRPAPTPGADLTVAEVLAAFWRHAEKHYGPESSELVEYRYSLRPVRELYAHTPAREFGPLALRAVREKMVAAGWCRTLINRRIGRVKRAVKWAVSMELVPPAVLQALQAVPGLARGRTEARESDPVQPVPDAWVDAVLERVSPTVAAMIRVQQLSGCRPGEVVQLRAADLNMAGPIWEWTLDRHKNAWRGKRRTIMLGPKAQQIIREYLTTDLAAPLFSPKRALAERSARLRAARKTPVQPSQRDRRTRRPKKAPGDAYTAETYGRAIADACRRAGVGLWGPNRLRHSRATEIRRTYGLEGAGAVLGHQALSATQIYAERDTLLAQRIAGEVG